MSFRELLELKEKIALSLIRDDGLIIGELNKASNLYVHKLIDYLQWNRMVPFFYDTVQIDNIRYYYGNDFANKLKINHQNNILNTMHIHGVFKIVCNKLAENGINIIALKGISLAHTVYSKPYLRTMSDLDIMVIALDFPKAKSTLLQMGALLHKMPESRLIENFGFDLEFYFMNTRIELHRHIMPYHHKIFLDADEVLINTMSSTIGGVPCQILTNEMQIYHLIHHLNRHIKFGPARLIWVMDINQLLKNANDLNWDKINTWIRKSNGIQNFNETLSFCRRITNNPNLANLKETDQISLKYLTRFNKPKTKNIGSFTFIKEIKSFKYKFLYITGKLFPSPKFLKQQFKLKSSLFVWIYYVVIYYQYFLKIIYNFSWKK